MRNDTELLRRYAEEHSETAFSQLVREHLNLVYSAALRETNGDSGLAEDLSQAVFSKMARDARRLTSHPCLSGWLYNAVRLMAANERRADFRRRRREQEAISMNNLVSEESPESGWQKIRPVLDDALHELSEPDRSALVLRFLEERSLRDIGLNLGLTENAARMRVDRALDKLRGILANRGITSTATGLAAALAAGVVTPAPAALVSAITAASMASAAASTSSTITLFKIFAMTKAQAGLVGLLFCAGMALPLWQETRISQIKAENTKLTNQVAELASQSEASAQAAKELEQFRQSQAQATGELARLRGMARVARRAEAEVADLRKQLAKHKFDSQASNSPMGEFMATAMEQHVLGKVARMTEKLGLTPQQTESVKEIFLRHAKVTSAGVQQVLSGKVNKDELAALGKDAGNQEDQIKEVLSEQQKAVYQDYKDEENAQDARLMANNELLQMHTAMNLTQEQQDQVFQILYEFNMDQLTGKLKNPESSSDPAAEAQWLFDQMNKVLEPLLTPAQMEAYKQQQDAQIKLFRDLASNGR